MTKLTCLSRYFHLVVPTTLLCILCTGASSANARPPAMRLLPDKTAAFVTVNNVPEFCQHFVNTALGQMSNDPKLAPFIQQVYGSLGDLVAQVKDRIELGLSEILALPQGEMTFAVVLSEDEPPAIVVLIDTGDQLANGLRLVKRNEEMIEKSGAKKSEETASGTKLTIYENMGQQRLKAAWFEKEGTLAVSSSPAALKKVLAIWNGEGGPTLAQNTDFAAVFERCKGNKGEEPQIVWYVAPVAIAENFAKNNSQVNLAMVMAKTLGVDGLKAVGGSLAMSVGQFDEVTHTHFLLANPRRGVLDLIALKGGDTKPEPWVPGDAAGYMAFQWDLNRTYRTITQLYDRIRGEGSFAEMVKTGFEDPLGIDLSKDILPSLGTRLTLVNRFEKPVTAASQAHILAVHLKDPDTVAKALEKMFHKNETSLTQETFSGKQYYRIKGRERSPQPPPSGENRPEPPRPCFGILGDAFLITEREVLYRKAVTTAETPGDSLGEALDFKLVVSKIGRRSGGVKPAMIAFNRPEEGMRFLYEMVTGDRAREGIRRQGERNPFFKSVNSAMEANPLPPFSVLEQYFAPGGALMVDDETGLHYMSFTLRRK
jgi:hypothetical protein